ncbi:MAG: arsenite methyltransferase [Methanosarcinales archaeon]|nr:arsenite methyltransferase [Methanosarcinales archaeon]
MKDEDIKLAVKNGYARIARKSDLCCSSSGCCGTAAPIKISKKIGYSDQEMMSVPSEANLGLGCGNPTALASLQEGEVVLDLGSGAGFDCFLAARRVGNSGRVIGVDMTPEMIEKARRNSSRAGFANVEFRLGELESLPLEDGEVDVIISNCVINLVPDKEQVFREAFRVLKPGGRIMVSDIVLLAPLPDFIRDSVDGYVGCVSGAVMKDQYLEAIRSAGFQYVQIVDESAFPLDCLANESAGQQVMGKSKIPARKLKEVEASISSLKVSAFKPA